MPAGTKHRLPPLDRLPERPEQAPARTWTALGRLVYERRKALGLTLDEAAARCGLRSDTNIQDIERGKSRDPKLTTAMAISRGLDIPIDDLDAAVRTS
jgi:transcriptional regulator with XRE-family HTH domain